MIADIVSEILAPSIDGLKTALQNGQGFNSISKVTQLKVPEIALNKTKIEINTSTNDAKKVYLQKPKTPKGGKNKINRGKKHSNSHYTLQFNTKNLVPFFPNLQLEIPEPLATFWGFHHIPEIKRFLDVRDWENFRNKILISETIAGIVAGAAVASPVGIALGIGPGIVGGIILDAPMGTAETAFTSLSFASLGSLDGSLESYASSQLSLSASTAANTSFSAIWLGLPVALLATSLASTTSWSPLTSFASFITTSFSGFTSYVLYNLATGIPMSLSPIFASFVPTASPFLFLEAALLITQFFLPLIVFPAVFTIVTDAIGMAMGGISSLSRAAELQPTKNKNPKKPRLRRRHQKNPLESNII